MTETITIDGVDRTTKVPRETIEVTESLYLGEVGEGKMTVRDTAGTIAIKGHKDVTIDQGASTPARMWTGFANVKTIGSRLDAVTAGRDIELTLKDSNEVLNRKIAREDDANRLAETVGARVTWVVGELEALGLAYDLGNVTYPSTVGMDKNDCRGRKWGDVLADCARAVRFNFGVRYVTAQAKRELVFRDGNAQTTDSYTEKITNDPADGINSTTVFAAMEAEPVKHTEDPEHVYSGVNANYRGGSVYRTRAATATEYVDRDGITEDTGDKDHATAVRNADTFLFESRSEEQHLELTLRLKETQLGLFRPGYRCQVKQVHLGPEGWGSFRWAQILRRTLSQPLGTDFDYNARLSLSPQEDGPPAAKLVQYAVGRGYANGLNLTLPNPVTIGNKLVCLITTKLDADPETPNITAGLNRWGAGAWTRMNGAIKTAAYPTGYGVSAWYKTADATDQTGYISEQNPAVAIYELAGAAPASATILDEDETVGGPNYDIGTQTPAVGAFAIAAWALGPLPAPASYEWAWDYSNSYAWQTPNPNPGISAGWTLDYSKWNQDSYSRDAYLPSSPWTVYAHADGDGSALLARVTPGESGHQFGALYFVIPPA